MAPFSLPCCCLCCGHARAIAMGCGDGLPGWLRSDRSRTPTGFRYRRIAAGDSEDQSGFMKLAIGPLFNQRPNDGGAPRAGGAAIAVKDGQLVVRDFNPDFCHVMTFLLFGYSGMKSARLAGVRRGRAKPGGAGQEGGGHSGGFAGGRRAIRGAQVSPIDIRAEVFAADGAGGHAFDGNAAVKRNAAINPLTDGALAYTQSPRQLLLTADDLCSSLNWTHGNSLAALDLWCQVSLNLFFGGRFRLAP